MNSSVVEGSEYRCVLDSVHEVPDNDSVVSRHCSRSLPLLFRVFFILFSLSLSFFTPFLSLHVSVVGLSVIVANP